MVNRRAIRTGAAAVLAIMVLGLAVAKADAAGALVARGKYMVGLMGCDDCHTPGYFLGTPDQARYLGGSDVGFEVPGQGMFVAPNFTPDKATGLGKWTTRQIIAALTTGVLPDGRQLAPIMPWRAFSSLTGYDARAIAAYLKSLKSVHYQVPGPFGPNGNRRSWLCGSRQGPECLRPTATESMTEAVRLRHLRL